MTLNDLKEKIDGLLSNEPELGNYPIHKYRIWEPILNIDFDKINYLGHEYISLYIEGE